jgi:hypothetical protein
MLVELSKGSLEKWARRVRACQVWKHLGDRRFVGKGSVRHEPRKQCSRDRLGNRPHVQMILQRRGGPGFDVPVPNGNTGCDLAITDEAAPYAWQPVSNSPRARDAGHLPLQRHRADILCCREAWRESECGAHCV